MSQRYQDRCNAASNCRSTNKIVVVIVPTYILLSLVALLNSWNKEILSL